MDIDVALDQARSAIEIIVWNGEEKDDETWTLIESFNAIDQWLIKGGMLPKDWGGE